MHKFVVLEFDTETNTKIPLVQIHGPYYGDDDDEESLCATFTDAQDEPRVFLAMTETDVQIATRMFND